MENQRAEDWGVGRVVKAWWRTSGTEIPSSGLEEEVPGRE